MTRHLLGLPLLLGMLGGVLVPRAIDHRPADVDGQPDDRASFLIRVQNMSTERTLRLSTGGTAAAPTAPVLWLVHTADDPLFTEGERDRGQGLESLAEDGSPAELVESLGGERGILSVGAAAVPVGESEAGPLPPGSAYEFEVSAERGQRLTLAFMFAQSNDLFYAPVGRGIALFDSRGRPVRGDVTSRLVLWDAGTEVNQEPGVGSDQAPRQSAPDTGAAESRPVTRIDHVEDGFTYPDVKEVVRVTVIPR